MPGKANPGTGKGDFRAFVERVNSDHLARLQFLVDPAHALDEAGIHLSEESKSELRTIVLEFLKSFPNIALLPTGLSSGSRERVVFAKDAGTAGGHTADGDTGSDGGDREPVVFVI